MVGRHTQGCTIPGHIGRYTAGCPYHTRVYTTRVHLPHPGIYHRVHSSCPAHTAGCTPPAPHIQQGAPTTRAYTRVHLPHPGIYHLRREEALRPKGDLPLSLINSRFTVGPCSSPLLPVRFNRFKAGFGPVLHILDIPVLFPFHCWVSFS